MKKRIQYIGNTHIPELRIEPVPVVLVVPRHNHGQLQFKKFWKELSPVVRFSIIALIGVYTALLVADFVTWWIYGF